MNKIKMRVQFYFSKPKITLFPIVADRLSGTAMEVTSDEFEVFKQQCLDYRREADEIIKRFEESDDGKRFNELIVEMQDIMQNIRNKKFPFKINKW